MSVVMKQNAFMISDVFFFFNNMSRPCWRGELNHFLSEKNIISQHIEGQCLFLKQKHCKLTFSHHSPGMNFHFLLTASHHLYSAS